MPSVRRIPYPETQVNEEGYIYVSNFSDSLSICVTPAPNSPSRQEHQSPRWIGLTFDSRDKEALFFTALKVFNPAAAVGGQIPAEDFRRGKWDNLMAQFERSVEQVTANLPMLRRLKEEYEDAEFSPDEISALREECVKVRLGTDDMLALSALEKLIRACDEALKEHTGLFFASD
jgi:hypothetical protein